MILINLSIVSAITITPRISKDNYQIFLFSILGFTDATLSITTDKIAFTNMHLELTEEFVNTSMKLERLAEPEEGIGAPAGAYQHIKVVNSNIRDAEMESLKIEFRIKKSWLERFAEDPNIVLMRYNQKDKWMEFPAKRIAESIDYVYYEAKVPGFGYLSYFSIIANSSVGVVRQPIIELEKAEEKILNKSNDAVSDANKATNAAYQQRSGITSFFEWLFKAFKI